MAKKTVGRPKSLERNKKKEKIHLNLTKEQKNVLIEKSLEEGISLSQLCIKALKISNFL